MCGKEGNKFSKFCCAIVVAVICVHFFDECAIDRNRIPSAVITDAVVDLKGKTATVFGNADVAALKKAIVEEGFEVM